MQVNKNLEVDEQLNEFAKEIIKSTITNDKKEVSKIYFWIVSVIILNILKTVPHKSNYTINIAIEELKECGKMKLKNNEAEYISTVSAEKFKYALEDVVKYFTQLKGYEIKFGLNEIILKITVY